jgi:hypothetical protein
MNNRKRFISHLILVTMVFAMFAVVRPDAAHASGEAFTITLQPKNTSVVCGNTATFKVKVNQSGVKYRWQWSKDGKNWSTCSVAKNNKATLNIETKANYNNRYFRCRVWKNGQVKYTKKVKLTCRKIITRQPSNRTVNYGEDISFSVYVDKKTNKPRYLWQYSEDGETWKRYTGEGYAKKTIVFSSKSKYSNCYFRCKIFNHKAIEYTRAVKATVKNTIPVSIVSHPESKTARYGTDVKFTVVATGSYLTYQWYYSEDGGVCWERFEDTEGAVGPTLTVRASLETNNLLVRCKIRTHKETILTNTAILTCTGEPMDDTMARQAIKNYCINQDEKLKSNTYLRKCAWNIYITKTNNREVSIIYKSYDESIKIFSVNRYSGETVKYIYNDDTKEEKWDSICCNAWDYY